MGGTNDQQPADCGNAVCDGAWGFAVIGGVGSGPCPGMAWPCPEINTMMGRDGGKRQTHGGNAFGGHSACFRADCGGGDDGGGVAGVVRPGPALAGEARMGADGGKQQTDGNTTVDSAARGFGVFVGVIDGGTAFGGDGGCGDDGAAKGSGTGMKTSGL